jgi:hypothetical protein
MRTVALTICAGMLSAAFCQDGGETKKMAAPALPFYDWGACPYESCAYRQWTAHRSATVYDAWKPERRPIAQLRVGEQVTGITGTVVTYQPGLIRMDGNLPDRDLQRGDTVLTYAYRGEGYSAVWFKGKYHSLFGGAHCAATYMELGRKSWWAEVKLISGRTGWVEMDLAQMPISLF